MKSLPIQQRAWRKRNALLRAAAIEFSIAGFEVTTAKSIAARAGVATGSFYQYFENKNDILCVIAEERFATLQQHIEQFKNRAVTLPGERLFSTAEVENLFREVLTFIYDFHASEPELHQVLEQRRGIDCKLAKILRAGESLLQQQVLSFVEGFNKPRAEAVADNLFAMVEGLVHRHVFGHSNCSKKEVIEIGASMFAAYFISI